MKFTLLIALSVLIIAGCHCKKKAGKTDLTKFETKEVKIDPSVMEFPDTLDYTIKEAAIEGDELKMKVEFKGGCGEHTFDMVFNGMYMKSLPLKITVFIDHKAKDEKCDEEIISDLSFNLKPVRRGEKPMFIKIIGYDEALKYEY